MFKFNFSFKFKAAKMGCFLLINLNCIKNDDCVMDSTSTRISEHIIHFAVY